MGATTKLFLSVCGPICMGVAAGVSLGILSGIFSCDFFWLERSRFFYQSTAEKERNSSAIVGARQRKIFSRTFLARAQSVRASEHHLLRERALNREQVVKEGESTPAQPAHRRVIVREHAYERVRQQNSTRSIACAPARVRREQRVAARIARARLRALAELPGVAQSKVESLSRYRMQCLGGIPE